MGDQLLSYDDQLDDQMARDLSNSLFEAMKGMIASEKDKEETQQERERQLLERLQENRGIKSTRKENIGQ